MYWSSLCIHGSDILQEDIFIVLHNMLKSINDVSEIYCMKDARIPLMRFKFDGILIDLPYARLNVSSVPENVNILNESFLNDTDETAMKSLSGIRVNKCIIQLVPNLEKFASNFGQKGEECMVM